jgi:DNA-binding response OmpR family regulator
MKPKILVVDGDQWMHGLVESALRDEDYAITTAGNGMLGLARALGDPPALVISDVRMRGMSGWRLIRTMRAQRRFAGTAFMFLTDMSSTESRRHGFRLGADDYLQKPFHPRELALRVASVLRRARARSKPEGPADLRGFSGAIEDISLASLLVLLEMERKTGMLVLSRRGTSERCRIFLRDGSIIAAFLDGDATRRHTELLYTILNWCAGGFSFKALPVEMTDEVRATTTHLLIEASRQLDEEERLFADGCIDLD